jgi:hypothetical protein
MASKPCSHTDSLGKRAIIALVSSWLPEVTLFAYNCECYDVSHVSCPLSAVSREWEARGFLKRQGQLTTGH